MKKQFPIRSLIMIVMFTLLSVTGFSQVATKVPQDTANARLSLIKNGVYRTDATIDTVAQSLRLQSTAANQVISTATLALVKKNNDTLAQSLRTIINSVDSSSVYLARNGNVGGFTAKILNTITTSASPDYSSGDNVGGINTLTGAVRISGGSGTIQDIIIWDKDAQSPSLVIDYWNTSPSGTYTDNAAEVIAGDHAIWLGSVSISSADFITQGAITRASIKGVGLNIKALGSANIYFTISTTSVINASSTSQIVIKHGILQD